jgi:hypothetical protein
MAFDTYSQRLQLVALKALSHCKDRYGANGLKMEQAIDTSISWRPSFHLRPTRFLIVAVEAADNLYPEALKGAAHDISHFDHPIAVYQACSLDVYQSDPKQAKISLLRRHGFGILTVDSDGRVTVQHTCIPLAQHISTEELDSQMAGLNHKLKVLFRAAHTTYLTNEGQGLQQAGQIVEGLVYSIAKQAADANIIPKAVLKQPLADMIDELYKTNQFKDHRAALGGAREFVKDFRNVASHAPKTAKAAADKIRKCKTGFMDAIAISMKLRAVMQAFGYRVHIYTT